MVTTGTFGSEWTLPRSLSLSASASASLSASLFLSFSCDRHGDDAAGRRRRQVVRVGGDHKGKVVRKQHTWQCVLLCISQRYLQRHIFSSPTDHSCFCDTALRRGNGRKSQRVFLLANSEGCLVCREGLGWKRKLLQCWLPTSEWICLSWTLGSAECPSGRLGESVLVCVVCLLSSQVHNFHTPSPQRLQHRDCV